MSSPFNEMTTFLLSPMMAGKQCIFLYRAGMGDQSFVADYEAEYNVVANLTMGTIGIHTATEQIYEVIVNYLTGLYGPCHDSDDECLIWEHPKALTKMQQRACELSAEICALAQEL
jgi:hypothetical protein